MYNNISINSLAHTQKITCKIWDNNYINNDHSLKLTWYA
jgi:hypothetical protein